MINVKQEDDNTFTISWDENDPHESMFNTWTEEDFINAIQDKLKALEELGVLDNATQAINEINDHIEDEIAYEEYVQASYEVSPYYIDQTAEEVEQDIQTLKDFLPDQDTELKEDRVVPPPNFPLFP